MTDPELLPPTSSWTPLARITAIVGLVATAGSLLLVTIGIIAQNLG